MKPIRHPFTLLALCCLIVLPSMFVLGGCGGSRIPKSVKKQGKARVELETIRHEYFDTGDVVSARGALDELAATYTGHVPEGLFKLRARLSEVQWLRQTVKSYEFGEGADCLGELARLRRDRGSLAALSATSHDAEKYMLKDMERELDRSEQRLRDCVLRGAESMDEQDRLLATSQDPALLRPIIDERDGKLASGGSLDEILPYLRISRGYRHSPALIARTDGLLLGSGDSELIAAYLFYYGDHRHDDALFRRLETLYAGAENWLALEAYYQRFQTQPRVAAAEQALQAHYEESFATGARLWDEEKFAAAAGYLAAVAPRSPQYGPARSLLREAADMGYYRWEQPDIWILMPPYRW